MRPSTTLHATAETKLYRIRYDVLRRDAGFLGRAAAASEGAAIVFSTAAEGGPACRSVTMVSLPGVSFKIAVWGEFLGLTTLTKLSRWVCCGWDGDWGLFGGTWVWLG